MPNFAFSALCKDDLPTMLPQLFEILYENMNRIAPTSNSRTEDYRQWSEGVQVVLEERGRRILMIYADGKLIGYFQYAVDGERLLMDEIQIAQPYQGSGAFLALYTHLLAILPVSLVTVEACAHKNNTKSAAVLRHLGLSIIGENKNGKSNRYRGSWSVLRDTVQASAFRRHAIQRMCEAVLKIAAPRKITAYLHGSAVMHDYRHGWSDLDLLVLTDTALTQVQAEMLVNLRQQLSEAEPDNPYYRKMEGAILPWDTFLSGMPTDTIVYYGTSGQRITDQFRFNALSQAELLDYGQLLCGEDRRAEIPHPTYEQLCTAIAEHLETVRRFAADTGYSLYAYGWLFDIARGRYTLRTGKIIAKTDALAWAMQTFDLPLTACFEDAMRYRQNPLSFSADNFDAARIGRLHDAIQQFADLLESDLRHAASVSDLCYCGHNCGRCKAYLASQGDSRTSPDATVAFYRAFSGTVLTEEEAVCHGGRSDTCMKLCRSCPFRPCCRRHGVSFCRDCPEYPCSLIADYEKNYVNRYHQLLPEFPAD